MKISSGVQTLIMEYTKHKTKHKTKNKLSYVTRLTFHAQSPNSRKLKPINPEIPPTSLMKGNLMFVVKRTTHPSFCFHSKGIF